MGIKKDIVAVIGKYTDAQGNEKKRYLKIGAIMETRNGEMIKMDSVPVGWDGWAYLNDPRSEGDRPQQATQGRRGGGDSSRGPSNSPPPSDDFADDDIPF